MTKPASSEGDWKEQLEKLEEKDPRLCWAALLEKGAQWLGPDVVESQLPLDKYLHDLGLYPAGIAPDKQHKVDAMAETLAKTLCGTWSCTARGGGSHCAKYTSPLGEVLIQYTAASESQALLEALLKLWSNTARTDRRCWIRLSRLVREEDIGGGGMRHLRWFARYFLGGRAMEANLTIVEDTTECKRMLRLGVSLGRGTCAKVMVKGFSEKRLQQIDAWIKAGARTESLLLYFSAEEAVAFQRVCWDAAYRSLVLHLARAFQKLDAKQMAILERECFLQPLCRVRIHPDNSTLLLYCPPPEE